MFARSTTVTGDPTAMDAAIAYVRDDVMPMLLAVEGCTGLSMLVDREGGQCIATSSWEDEAMMRASDGELRPVRNRLAEILSGPMTVEEWEVAAMHRDHRMTHQGSCARVVWMRTDHADVDRGIDIYKTAIAPQFEEFDGFCSTSLMVNRAMSRACATTSFDSTDAMAASRERSWAIRDAGVRDAGVDVIDVAEYELAFAHLRLPELA